MNGLMIDCCRTLEKHDYYHRLIDFMADWKMTHLQLHVTDNHGCAIAIPGFTHLAMPHAFTAADIAALCSHAADRGITIIPELETFGHSQYLTDHPDYSHLYAGVDKGPGEQKGGGMNPLDPRSLALMRRLIDGVIDLFPSPHIHIGCDEVKMAHFLEEEGVREEDAWADYVNALADHVRQAGRTPIIWADQLKKKPETAARLRKDIAVMEWDYEADATDAAIARLREHGFVEVMASPSIIFCRYRIFPTEIALSNTRRMVRHAFRHELTGVMNTAWCPHRYLTGALYYAIAYSAYLVEHRGTVAMSAFRQAFARSTFATDCNRALERFLSLWPRLNIRDQLARALCGEAPTTAELEAQLRAINTLGREALHHAARFKPRANHDIWHAMALSARVAWICAESHCAADDPVRREAFERELDTIIVAVEEEWDRTRQPDDPHKYTPHFKEPCSAYLIPLLYTLRQRSRSTPMHDPETTHTRETT